MLFAIGVVGLPASTRFSPSVVNQSVQSFMIAALSSGVGGVSGLPPVYTSRNFAIAVLLSLVSARHVYAMVLASLDHLFHGDFMVRHSPRRQAKRSRLQGRPTISDARRRHCTSAVPGGANCSWQVLA